MTNYISKTHVSVALSRISASGTWHRYLLDSSVLCASCLYSWQLCAVLIWLNNSEYRHQSCVYIDRIFHTWFGWRYTVESSVVYTFNELYYSFECKQYTFIYIYIKNMPLRVESIANLAKSISVTWNVNRIACIYNFTVQRTVWFAE